MKASKPDLSDSSCRDKVSGSPWQANLLAGMAGAGALAVGAAVLFSVKLGYEGFKAGEMGIMIGIFSLVWIVPLLLWLALKVVSVIGIIRRRRWAVVLALISGIVELAAGVFSLGAGLTVFLAVVFFQGVFIRAAVACLKLPFFHPAQK